MFSAEFLPGLPWEGPRDLKTKTWLHWCISGGMSSLSVFDRGKLVAVKCMNYILATCSTPGIVGMMWKEHTTGAWTSAFSTACAMLNFCQATLEKAQEIQRLWQPRCGFIGLPSQSWSRQIKRLVFSGLDATWLFLLSSVLFSFTKWHKRCHQESTWTRTIVSGCSWAPLSLMAQLRSPSVATWNGWNRPKMYRLRLRSQSVRTRFPAERRKSWWILFFLQTAPIWALEQPTTKENVVGPEKYKLSLCY